MDAATGGAAGAGAAAAAPRAERAARLLGAAAVLLLPVAFLPDRIHGSFAPAKLLVMALVAVPAAVLAALATRRRPDPLRGLRAALLAFVTVAVAVAAAEGWPHGLPAFLHAVVLPVALLEIGAAFGRRAGGAERLVVLLAASAVPVLVVGAARRLLFGPEATWVPDDAAGGLAATIGNSNELADYAAPVLVAGIGALGALAGRARIAVAGGAAAAGVLLLWSDARGGLLAALAGLVALVLAGVRLRDRAARGPAVAAAVLIAAGAATLAAVPAARARALSAVDPSHPTVRARLLTWGSTLDLVADHPLTGVGAGRFGVALHPYRTAGEWRLHGPDRWIADPHSEPLWLLAEGGVAGAVLLVVAAAGALLVLLRAAASPWSGARRLLPCAAAAAAAFAVLALVHSPLHHPAGALAPLTLLGALAARTGGRRPAPWLKAGTAVLLVLAAVTALLEVDAAGRLETALAAQRRVVESGRSGLRGGSREAAVKAVRASLQELGGALERAADTPFQDVRRDLRVVAVALDLYRLRSVLEEGGLLVDAGLLPDAAFVGRLCRRVLARCPHQPTAENHYARLLLMQGRVAQAVFRLRDAIEASPDVPRLRRNLARVLLAQDPDAVTEPLRLVDAELALCGAPLPGLEMMRGRLCLRLGCQAATAGTYAFGPPDRGGSDALAKARRLADAGGSSAADARVHALIHLGRHPTSLEGLALITSLGYGPLRDEPDARQDADHAVARTRVFVARDALLVEDHAAARRALSLARRKDPKLADVDLLLARLAAEEGDVAGVLAAVERLVGRGLAGEDLERLLARDPDLAQLLRDGTLDAVLGAGR